MKATLAFVCVFFAAAQVNAARPDALLASQVVMIAGNRPTNVSSTVTNFYDPRGQMFQSVGEGDVDYDGLPDVRTTSTYSYDNRGHLTQIVGRSVWTDTGNFYSSFTEWRASDNHGRVTNLVLESFYQGQPEPSVWHGSYSYDNQGHLTQIVGEWRWGDNLETQIETISYNARGNITQDFQHTESNLGYSRTILTCYQYDQRGSPSRSVAAFDENGDGVGDASIETTFDCDRTGRMLGFSNRTLDSTGAVIQTQTATYSSDRNIQTYTEMTDDANDGTIDRVVIVTAEYLSPGTVHQN